MLPSVPVTVMFVLVLVQYLTVQQMLIYAQLLARGHVPVRTLVIIVLHLILIGELTQMVVRVRATGVTLVIALLVEVG